MLTRVLALYAKLKHHLPVQIWEIGTNIVLIRDLGSDYFVYFDDATWHPIQVELFESRCATTPLLKRFELGAISGPEQTPPWPSPREAIRDAHRILRPRCLLASWHSSPALLRDITDRHPVHPRTSTFPEMSRD